MVKFKSLFDLLSSNPTEEDCIKYFEEIRWKGKPVSPFDPISKVYKLTDGKYKCKNTNRRFTVITKSIFSSTKLPLRKWFEALKTFSSHKKGISSHQLARDIGITQGSAWYLLQRLRYASNIPLFKDMLKGSVEVDEAFIGGKNKNRHWDKKVPNSQGRSWTDKIPILGILERDSGKILVQVVPNTKLNTLVPIIKDSVEKGSNVYTDEWYKHSNLYQDFNHQIVNHSAKQYVNGEATTNRMENPWSHLKRMIYGTYIHISRKHSQRYMDEFALRFNTRKYNEQERFDLLLLSTVGKHLTYRELVSTF